MRLGFIVIKYTSKFNRIILLLGCVSAPLLGASAYAQDRIRANPEYQAPADSEPFSLDNVLITDDLRDDFIQFLNPQDQDDSGQYIQLKEQESSERKIIATSTSIGADEKKAPLLQFDHQYKYDPSLSFSLAPGMFGSGNSTDLTGIGGSQLRLSLNPSRTEVGPYNNRNSIELLVGSSFSNKPAGRFNSILQNSLVSQRAYNLSLGLGYSGFSLGASFSRSTSLLSSELSGYDIGFGYRGESWSANIRVGEYSKNHQLLAGRDFNLYNNVSAYELGAAYRLFSNVNLTGRFTYYSYGLGADLGPLVDVKSLILGTNVSF